VFYSCGGGGIIPNDGDDKSLRFINCLDEFCDDNVDYVLNYCY